ncbi:MAG: NUDIX hydrolase [Acidimicrobiia bacterium]|nr:NUDIX hydrolase [Acidimicrobiia bacterium]
MEPRDAATVMLVRDAPGSPGRLGQSTAARSTVEVFMLRRNLRSEFVAGAYVFPGGAVDADDRGAPVTDLIEGLDAGAADALLGVASGALGFWVAAIRESFEEAGVLLARDAASGTTVEPRLVAELAPARPAVAAGEQSFADLVRLHGLVLDAGALRVFAHWITPEPAPRRYDTWFFVAPAPPGHTYEHDFDETVASEWVRPSEALERARRGEFELIYPTFKSLQAIARFASTSDLLGAVDAAWRGPPPALRVMNPDQGWQVRLPGDTAGDDAEADALAHSTTHRAGAGTAGKTVR